jgi:hypothetical protein
VKRIAKFLQLPGRRRWWLLRVWIELNATAVGLFLWPLPTLLRWFGTNPATSSLATPSVLTKDEIIWTIRAAASLAWKPTCAVRALVAERLFRTQGYPVQFKVGVRSGEDFQAHAWVEDETGILVGESERPYHPLPDLSARDLVSPS